MFEFELLFFSSVEGEYLTIIPELWYGLESCIDMFLFRTPRYDSTDLNIHSSNFQLSQSNVFKSCWFHESENVSPQPQQLKKKIETNLNSSNRLTKSWTSLLTAYATWVPHIIYTPTILPSFQQVIRYCKLISPFR